MSSHNVVIHSYKTGGKRQIEVDGVLYESRNAMMAAYKLCESDIYQFKKTYSYEEAISLAIEYRKGQEKKKADARKRHEEEKAKHITRQKKMGFTYYGRTFKTFSDCVHYCEDRFLKDIEQENGIQQEYSYYRWCKLNVDSIKASAKRNNRSLKEQLTFTIKRKFLNERKIRSINPKYAFCYFNTKEKAMKYCSTYKVNDSVCFRAEVDGRGKYVVRYIPSNCN